MYDVLFFTFYGSKNSDTLTELFLKHLYKGPIEMRRKETCKNYVLRSE